MAGHRGAGPTQSCRTSGWLTLCTSSRSTPRNVPLLQSCSAAGSILGATRHILSTSCRSSARIQLQLGSALWGREGVTNFAQAPFLQSVGSVTLGLSPHCFSPPTQQPKLSLLCAHSRAQLYSSICRAQTAARHCAHSRDAHNGARAMRTDSRDLCSGSQHCWSHTQLDAHAAKAMHSWILAGWSLSTARAVHSWSLTQLDPAQLEAAAPGCLHPQGAHFGTRLIFFLLHCHFPAWLCLLPAPCRAPALPTAAGGLALPVAMCTGRSAI